MKPRLILVLLAAVALVATGCTGHDAVDQTAGGQFRFVSATTLGQTWKPADRKTAGDFTAQRLDGKGTLSLSADAGKITVVNFWASWCVPCRTETPQFDLVYRGYKSKGVAFLGVDFKDQRGKGQSFVKDNHISYPMVFDKIGKIALQLGDIPALTLPFTVLIDRQQRVAAVYTNQVQPKDLERALNRLLAEPGPSVAATPAG
jgi:peroxiredoxin